MPSPSKDRGCRTHSTMSIGLRPLRFRGPLQIPIHHAQKSVIIQNVVLSKTLSCPSRLRNAVKSNLLLPRTVPPPVTAGGGVGRSPKGPRTIQGREGYTPPSVGTSHRHDPIPEVASRLILPTVGPWDLPRTSVGPHLTASAVEGYRHLRARTAPRGLARPGAELVGGSQPPP